VGYPRLFLPTIFCVLAAAQPGQDATGTRQLYYLGPEAPAGKTAPSSQPATRHLGLRYNIVLIHDKSKDEEISSSHVLKEGDCFAIDLQTNHAGYLYVLAKQSSGAWLPLFPSPDMAGQSNQIDPFTRVRVPSGYCFTVHKPAGKETLFVVFSRDKKDFFELYENVKNKHESQLADSTVEHWNQQFGSTRDILVTRIAEPVKKDEPRGAVYVVNTSDKLSSNLVTKIEIVHR